MDSRVVVTPPYVAGPLRLQPFRGLMLSPGRIGDPSSMRAFARPYRDVAARLSTWERRGEVQRDEIPAVYVHEYTAEGITIRGLVGALDISRPARTRAERAVYPHEGVHPAQADELAHRMAQMRMNPAPILLVHRGPASVRVLIATVTARAPAHEFTDRAGQHHRVWAITDRIDLAQLNDSLAGSRAMIADGHHRYAAYLRLQHDAPGGSHDLGLVMLVDQDETPLFLGAIHRLLVGTGLEELRAAALACSNTFELTSRTEAVGALGPQTLAATDGETWATIGLRLPPESTAVQLVHDALVPALVREPVRVGHHHSVAQTLTHLAHTRGTALLLPTPDFDHVLQIVASDRLLPEKATSFQPKPSLGVLIRPLLDE